MKTSSNLSKICFGCEALGGTDWGKVDVKQIKDAIRYAIELGVNSFDTAGVYGLGLSEERLCEALGSKRHDLLLVTKGGLSWKENESGSRAIIYKNSSRIAIEHDILSSLRRLKIERIPIFFIHWPDPNTAFQETFECLNEMRHKGRIQFVGCSNFSLEALEESIQYCKIDYVQIPINLLYQDQYWKIFEFCSNHDIKIFGYNVLASGILTGKYSAKSKFGENDRRSRSEDFKKYINLYEKKKLQIHKELRLRGLSMTQLAISQIFDQCQLEAAIVGIKSKKQLDDIKIFI